MKQNQVRSVPKTAEESKSQIEKVSTNEVENAPKKLDKKTPKRGVKNYDVKDLLTDPEQRSPHSMANPTFFSLEDYRKNIVERYSRKILNAQAAPEQKVYEEYLDIDTREHETPKIETEVPVRTQKPTYVSNQQHSELEKKPERLPQKRAKSCRKSRDFGIHKDREDRKASSRLSRDINKPISRNLSRSLLKSQNKKRKINVKRNIEEKAKLLTIGELNRLYKIRRPSSQDLNLIQMLMAL